MNKFEPFEDWMLLQKFIDIETSWNHGRLGTIEHGLVFNMWKHGISHPDHIKIKTTYQEVKAEIDRRALKKSLSNTATSTTKRKRL